jgi:GAF domain-containing protein/HAMP domain-containing protein
MEKSQKPWKAAPDVQSQRAFWISMIWAVMMALALAIFQATGAGLEVPGFFNARFFVGLVAVSSLISIVLARRGQAQIGISLINISFQIAVLFVVLTVSGIGVAAGVLVATVTVAMTSALFKTRWTNAEIIIGILVAAVAILLDLFSPYPRVPIKTPEVVNVMTPVMVLAFMALIVWQFNSYSLRVKMLIALVGATVISSVVIAYFNTTSATEILTSSVGQRLTSDANSSSARLSGNLETQLGLLFTLSSSDETLSTAVNESQTYTSTDPNLIAAEVKQRDAQWKQASDSDPLISDRLNNQTALDLRDFQKQFPDHLEVFITDAYGGLAASTNRTSDYDQSDEGWWQAAYNNGKGATYVSQRPEYDESISQFSVLMAIPLYNRETGRLIGILRTTYRLSELTTLLTQTKVGNTGEIDIIFPGEPVKHIHGEAYEDFDPELWKTIQANKTNYFSYNFYGTQSLIGVAPMTTAGKDSVIDQLGWVVMVHQDETEALAPVENQRRNTLIVSIVIMLGISALAAGLAQILVTPIAHLTAVAEQVGSGNLDARAPLETRDEVGRLAESFNLMTIQLQSTLQGLEQRVAERTRALATSAEVSRQLSTIFDEKKLVVEVVERVKEAFNYYHAHIYFFDDNRETLLMAGGTGEAGQILLARGHHIPRGKGLVGRAASTNAAVFVPDTSQDPNWLPNPLLPETKSEIAVPISVGGDVMGVLDVQQNIVEGLNNDDVELLQSLANQIAIALQNIRQYQKAQKMADDLSVVANVGIATSTITEIDTLLQDVVDLSKKSFNLYHAHIYLLNDAGDTLVLTAGAGEVGKQMKAEKRSIPVDSEKSLVARAARGQSGVVVNDVRADPEFLPNPLLPETRSEMAVPMMIAGKVIGVLDVQSELINRFTEVDVNITTTLASQVAAAIQNARAYIQAQKQADRETTINLIAQKIQGTTTIETALQVVARELGHALGMKPTMAEINPEVLSDKPQPSAIE